MRVWKSLRRAATMNVVKVNKTSLVSLVAGSSFLGRLPSFNGFFRKLVPTFFDTAVYSGVTQELLKHFGIGSFGDLSRIRSRAFFRRTLTVNSWCSWALVMMLVLLAYHPERSETSS